MANLSNINNKFLVTTGGNVGIGVTGPVAKLDIGGNTAGSVQAIFGRGNSDSSFTVRYTNGITGTNDTVQGTIGLDYANGYWADMAAVKFTRESTSGELAFYTSASATSGVERMRIDNAGNVGIGETNPTYKFEVRGSGTNTLQRWTTTEGGALLLIPDNDAANPDWTFIAGTNEDIQIDPANNDSGLIVKYNGNVGIGTDSPNEKLQVAGNIHAYAPSGIDAGLFASTAAGSTTIAIRSSGITHFNGGNVGIGTTNPDNKLHVYGGRILIDNILAGQSAMQFNHAGTEMGVIYRPGGYSDQLRFFMTGAGDTMTLNSSGNVGIGTTTPGAKLQIGSATYAPNGNLSNNLLQIKSPSGFAYLTIGNGDSADSTSYIGGASGFIVLGSVTDAGAASEHIRMTNTGNVGIGTTSPSRGPLHINENSSGYCQVHLTNDTSGTTSGDGLTLFTNGADAGLMQRENSYLLFGTNDTERMRIDSSGVVKISNTGDAILTITSGTTNTAKINLGDSSNDDAGIIAYTNDAGGSDTMAFTVGTSEKMRIINSGNVGIGTTNPTAKLKVIGANDSWACQIENTQALPYGLSVNTTGTAGTTFNSAFYTATGTGMYIVNNGRVGIGTTSPSTELQVESTNPIITLQRNNNGNAGGAVQFRGSDSVVDWQMGTNQVVGLGLEFNFQNSNKVYIETGGNVGIGTTTPGAKLEVAGDVIVTGGYTDQNGVRTFRDGGVMTNGATYNIDITVDDDTGTGTVHHITAMMTHYDTTYGCVLDCYAYTRGTQVSTQTDLLNQSNSNAGGWTVTKPNNTTLRLTKSAGTYSGAGNYQVVVVTSTP